MRSLNITGLLVLLLFGAACRNQQSGKGMVEVPPGSQPEIRFEKTEHHFGDVLQGEKVGYGFIFTNVGDASLVIRDATASCGCTVPRYSSEPIPPGGKGSVEVVFDSSGRLGQQSKTVTVQTNGKEPVVYLKIEANIVIKKD
jgi:hypothetical protein